MYGEHIFVCRLFEPLTCILLVAQIKGNEKIKNKGTHALEWFTIAAVETLFCQQTSYTDLHN